MAFKLAETTYKSNRKLFTRCFAGVCCGIKHRHGRLKTNIKMAYKVVPRRTSVSQARCTIHHENKHLLPDDYIQMVRRLGEEKVTDL